MRLRPQTRWGLGKLGGVIVVVAGTAVLIYVLFFRATSESDPSQGAIHGYYESRIGGSVPSDVADRLHVDVCDIASPLAESGATAIVRCDVSIGKRGYRPCFGFDVNDVVVSGPLQIDRPDCDRLVYDPTRRDFVLSRS